MTLPRRSRQISWIAFVLALSIRGAGSPPQVIPATGAPTGPRTGLLVGQVLDSAGTPVPEAIVTLTMPGYSQELPTTPRGRVLTDGEGRYFFADLPAGEFWLGASKEGYRAGTYGQRRPSGSGQRFTLAEGERRTDATLTLWKHAVIAGTVVDDAGEPVVGVAVRALLKDIVGGRTGFGGASWLIPATTTDDRGMFRLSQLTPATYVVVVPSTHATVPTALLSPLDTAVRNDLFRAGVSEIAPPGQPRTQQAGDFALLTLSNVLIPPVASPGGGMRVYRTTYFPSAMTPGAAMPIALGAGEERTGVAITLRPVPAVRVSGRLVTPDGSTPPPMTIRLVGESSEGFVGEHRPSGPGDVVLPPVVGMSDASGRFTLIGVPAGDYVIEHANPFLISLVQQGLPAYWISQRITVGDRDLSDLSVALRPALRLEGRFEFHSASGPQSSPQPFLGITFETAFGGPGQVAVSTRREAPLTFSTVAPGGQYIVRPYQLGPASGWVVQSVTAGGKDITERVLDLQTDMTSIVVTFTDRPSKVSGSVTDARGAPGATATVLAFPVDRERWSGFGTNPRLLTSAPASRDGAYTFAHLPPGDYHLIAVDDAEAEGWRDPERLDVLARQATRLTVVEARPQTLDLTLKVTR